MPAARAFAAALVAGPLHVPVGEEHVVRYAEQLVGSPFHQVAVLHEAREELAREIGVVWAGARSRNDVVADIQRVEGRAHVPVPPGDVRGVILPRLLGGDGDGDPVVVRS